MQIIKDKQIVEDNWTHIADDESIQDGNISVSLERWHKDKDQLVNHNGQLGIRLSPTDTAEDIADDLGHFQLIELDFPVFTDGRAFTQARLLRGRYHYNGEIRAIGSYMLDQIFYLSRVGVNAFKLENPDQLAVALATLDDFSVKYQTSVN